MVPRQQVTSVARGAVSLADYSGAFVTEGINASVRVVSASKKSVNSLLVRS